MFEDVTTIVIYFIYFVVAVAIYHYALPKNVRDSIRGYLGIFFRWIIFGKKDRGKKEKKMETKQVVKEKVVEKEDFDWNRLL